MAALTERWLPRRVAIVLAAALAPKCTFFDDVSCYDTFYTPRPIFRNSKYFAGADTRGQCGGRHHL